MSKLLPIDTILAAVAGDPDAVIEVFMHYDSYIAYLSSRYGYFDVEAYCRLQSQLLQALFKFKTDH